MARPAADFPVPTEGMLTTNIVVAGDVEETGHFYSDLLGGEVVFQLPGEFAMVKLANTWVVVVGAGDGTPDKPDVTVGPPTDVNQFHSFMALRVPDIESTYRELAAKGVEFITPPLDNGGFEMRCYIRDPDGRIIEVGEATGMLEFFDMEKNDN